MESEKPQPPVKLPAGGAATHSGGGSVSIPAGLLENTLSGARDIASRVKQFMAQNDLNQTELARMMGVNQSNMSKYLSGTLTIGPSFVNRMVAEMGVSKEWLISGKGDIWMGSQQGDMPPKGAAVYDVDVTAGPAGRDFEFADEHIIGYVDIPGVDPEYPLVRVSGESMTPVIIDGALISVRPVSVGPEIFWGHIYVVVLDDYRMVKYVHRCPDDKTKVLLRSANPDYDDMEVPIRSIRRLFLVQSILNTRRLY